MTTMMANCVAISQKHHLHPILSITTPLRRKEGQQRLERGAEASSAYLTKGVTEIPNPRAVDQTARAVARSCTKKISERVAGTRVSSGAILQAKGKRTPKGQLEAATRTGR